LAKLGTVQAVRSGKWHADMQMQKYLDADRVLYAHWGLSNLENLQLSATIMPIEEITVFTELKIRDTVHVSRYVNLGKFSTDIVVT
jgi:hypothetical protein